MTHTPGPVIKGRGFKNGGFETIIIDGKEWPTRLIASAPELLAVVKEFIRLDDESGLAANDGGGLVAALHYARAALAKAKQERTTP